MIPSDFIVKQLLIYHDYAAFSVPDKLPSFFRRYKQPVSFCKSVESDFRFS